ncbi:MAG: hypothetical protein IJQ08_05660 [Synergistaceae bacterium]|nr:hypothetical protein [Synergistaceae bacterium]
MSNDFLISVYLSGIDSAMSTCSSAIEQINNDLATPDLSHELILYIDKRIECVRKLLDKVEVGFEHIRQLQENHIAA